MMRVLHVHSGNLYGGVETLLVTLARLAGLCPALESEFALSYNGRLAAELRESGAQVHQLGEVRARYPLAVWRARRRLGQLLCERRFDAAVCHMAWAQAIFGATVSAAKIPLVFWMHDAAGGRHWLERWARRTPPDLTVCNSRFTAATLPRLYPDSPYELVHCPVAPGQPPLTEAERAALRRQLDTPPDAVVIVQASRLEPWKGQMLHLEALAHLRDLPGWFCWIAGGAQRPHEAVFLDQLRAAADRFGIAGHLRFLGDRSDVARVLAAADICCQPNLGPEPFGIAFVEALGAGLPAVSTAIGGATEIIDETCGILVPSNDQQALATALRRLIESPAERARLGAAGPRRARTLCDPATQMGRLVQVLERAAAAANGAARLAGALG